MSAIDWLRMLDGFRHCFRTFRMVVLTLISSARPEADTAEEPR
jgi:hypothetical protein